MIQARDPDLWGFCGGCGSGREFLVVCAPLLMGVASLSGMEREGGGRGLRGFLSCDNPLITHGTGPGRQLIESVLYHCLGG